MESRYWGALLAAIALAVVAFGTGVFTVSMHQPHESRYQRYSLGTELVGKAGSRPVSRSPCIDPQGTEESDLCAQWRAAIAAEGSAFWAKWGFWIAAFGTSALLATILQGRTALARAHESNVIAQQIGESQMRAYLSVVRAELHVDHSSRDHQRLPNFDTILHFHNSGQTPAVNVSYYCTAAVVAWRDADCLPDIDPKGEQRFVTNVTPGGNSTVNAMCFGIARQWHIIKKLWKNTNDHMPIGDFPMLILHGTVFYEDVFGNLFKSRFGFVYGTEIKDDSPVFIDDLPTVQTRIPTFVSATARIG